MVKWKYTPLCLSVYTLYGLNGKISFQNSQKIFMLTGMIENRLRVEAGNWIFRIFLFSRQREPGSFPVDLTDVLIADLSRQGERSGSVWRADVEGDYQDRKSV